MPYENLLDSLRTNTSPTAKLTDVVLTKASESLILTADADADELAEADADPVLAFAALAVKAEDTETAADPVMIEPSTP